MSSFGSRPRESFVERHHLLVFLGLAALGVGLATLSLKQPESVRPLHDLGASLTGPLVRVGATVSGAVDDSVAGVLEALSARERLSEALDLVDELKLYAADRDALAAENETLRAITGLAATLPMTTVAARVIYHQRSPDWILILDRGREAGIAEDQAVITPDGVVGKVLSVGEGVARVQGVLDGDAGVAVMIGDDRRQTDAIVADATGGHCRLTHVELLADIREGDRVLTSGLDLIYPRGLLFGEVVSVEGDGAFRQDVLVRPAVDFSRVEQVLVVVSSSPARERARAEVKSSKRGRRQGG